MKIFNELELKLEDKYLELKEARRAYDSLIDSVLEKDAEYIAAVNELGALNFKLAKAEYTGDKAADSLKNEVAVQNKKVLKIKDNLIKFNKISNYEYACPICKDTGFIDGKPCKCRNKYLSAIILNEAGAANKDLTPFAFNAPTNLETIYEALRTYANKLPAVNKIINWVFSGAPGTGKTYLSKAIANTAEKNGNVVIYLTATELNAIFLKMHTCALDKAFTFDCLTNCDLLVVDDLGTEPVYNNVTVEYLVALISARLDLKKPFIITTNLNANELKARYNDRLASRLNDKQTTRFIEFKGVDLRTVPPRKQN